MRVVIDARWIFEEISGIGLYTRELIRNLAEIDADNSYCLLFDNEETMQREQREIGFDQTVNFRTELVSYGVFSPLSQLRLPALLFKLKAEIFHSPNYMVPFIAFPRHKLGSTACVITIHDLIPLLFPHYTPRALKTRFFPVFKAVMREAAKRADAIIAPSNSTRKDISAHLLNGEESESRIRVVYQGTTSEYVPAEKKGNAEPTILYVGRFDPYKNVPKLVEAYGRLLDKGFSARLRIVGKDDERYPEAKELAEELGLSDKIQWDGYIDGAGLLDAYQQADLLVLPSRYEGFGLTALEAMACGTPVVCGSKSSLPEVVGDAAITVEPDNVDEIVSAIASILTDPQKAEQLRKASLARASEFTWKETAMNTLKVYESLRP